MHAITVSEFGPPSVLTPAELPTPQPGPGQFLVEVTGAGVGPWDAKIRQGQFGARTFPYVPGAELSGLIVGVGEGAGPFASGAAVFGQPGMTGAYAEYAVVDADAVAAAPTGLDLAAAGGMPVGAVTALEGIDDHLRLGPGETVLVAGAAGGVGSFVVQIARARGARVVATASPANHQYLAGLGADRVLDYHGDWVSEAAGVDAAFDCVGGATWTGCVEAVRAGGRAVTIAASPDQARRDDVTVSGSSNTVTRARLEDAAGLVASGQVRVEVSARLPLDEAARAHELIETGHTRGKIVLIPG
ncbi:MAG TPA: NADP-dependent oxidoreductase [Acidimicrobiia bacterium]|nr:NADP-dependent oxidoreductase [Acidimicrobiia bacterium]